MKMNVREAAFHSLLAVCKDGSYSNIIVSKTIQKQNFDDRDRRFYTELVYGTLRTLNYLDHIISTVSTRDIKKLDPVCLAILRCGLYQLFFMDKVPPSAACNEAVKTARRFGNAGMAKFVNALLRNSLRKKETFTVPTPAEDVILHLSLTYHQPTWLVRKWVKDFGREEATALCRYFDRVPDLCVRTNTTRTTREKLMTLFTQKGVPCRCALHAPEGIYLEKNPGIRTLTEIAGGLGMIQDEPSQLVAHVVAPQAGEVIFDVCAAPGGKTTHLAALGGSGCLVYGFDIYEHKLKLIKENARMLGLENIRTVLQDAVLLGHRYAAKADRVLVDAPCSGLGILRRKPDLRWRKRPEDLKALPPFQRQLLESAAKCVKPGGILVYSTCTINKEENGAVVDSFLAAHAEFKAVPIGNSLGFRQDTPYLCILPQRDGLDGFFIAKMQKA
mgnify:FL=1|jgi:16S rRNA (cytosine967-C5)-methyltransferase